MGKLASTCSFSVSLYRPATLSKILNLYSRFVLLRFFGFSIGNKLSKSQMIKIGLADKKKKNGLKPNEQDQTDFIKKYR